MNYFSSSENIKISQSQTQPVEDQDLKISKDIYGIIVSAKTSIGAYLPKNSSNNPDYQFLVDMIYDYLFNKTGLKSIINCFKKIFPNDNSGSIQINRFKVTAYSDMNLNIFMNDQILPEASSILSNLKFSLDLIADELKNSKSVTGHKNLLKTAGIEEVDPELRELASNYGFHELDESGFNLIFGL